MIVLMLSGWSGVGKDAAAALLVEEMQFLRKAFADALKEDVAFITGLSLDEFHTYRKDLPCRSPAFPDAKTPRDMILTHARLARSADPDVFARLIGSDLLDLDPETESKANRIVISDWRYRNEYSYLRELLPPQCQIIRARIQRPSVRQSDDPSEHDLDGEPMDIEIMNSGGIGHLRSELKRVLHGYLS
jgi:hypothetical protein